MSGESPRTWDVVIPARNAASTILEQLDAILRNDQPELLEVIVVDSCSTDSTAASVSNYADQRWGKVRLLSAIRPGANVARNTGIAAGHADMVLMCDADDVVASGWAAALTSSLSRKDAVRGRYDLERLNSPDLISMRGPLASTAPPPPHQAIGGLGGNCGFRREVWEALGGLANHHHGSDDIEFFWRARLAGFRIGYEHEAVVHYRLRPEARDLYLQQRAWAENRALLYREFGRHGFIHRRSLPGAIRQWSWLLVHLRDRSSTDPTRQGRYLRVLANGVGNARGSLRHRVWFP